MTNFMTLTQLKKLQFLTSIKLRSIIYRSVDTSVYLLSCNNLIIRVGRIEKCHTKLNYKENFHKQTFLNPERLSSRRYIHLLVCSFVCLHRNVSDLTVGDVTSDVSFTSNALGVCLFVYGFVPCVENSETFLRQ